jgi:hypothetical protein
MSDHKLVNDRPVPLLEMELGLEPMPIPTFTIDGVLPPYVGPAGPGGAAEDLSPYVVTALEVVTTFGRTGQRIAILHG